MLTIFIHVNNLLSVDSNEINNRFYVINRIFIDWLNKKLKFLSTMGHAVTEKLYFSTGVKNCNADCKQN